MSLDETHQQQQQKPQQTTSFSVISFRYIKELKTLADEIRLNALPHPVIFEDMCYKS